MVLSVGPLVLLLCSLLRIEFLQVSYHSISMVFYPDRSDILGTGYASAGSPPALVENIVPTCRNHTCSVNLSPSMLLSSPTSVCEHSSKNFSRILCLCSLHLKNILWVYMMFCLISSLRNFK